MRRSSVIGIVVGSLRTYAEFLASGAVDPAKTESKLRENWPKAVRDAIDAVLAFNAKSC